MKTNILVPADLFLEQNLGGRKLGVLLDAGCGDASFLDDLLFIAVAQEVWGIDVDEDALSQARAYLSKLGVYGHFRCRSSLLPIPDRFFDSISFQDLLHHLCGNNFFAQPSGSLKEAILCHLASMDLMLRPGGRMIISEYIVDELLPTARKNRIAMHNMKAEVDERHGISHSYSMDFRALHGILKEFFEKGGYEIESCGVFDAQCNPVMAGRKDRGLEIELDNFYHYITTLKQIAGSSRLMYDLHRRFAAVREATLVHGLLSQRRLMLIARKEGSQK